MFLKELRCCFVRTDEVLPKKKVVDFVRIDDLLEWDVVVAQPLREIDGLTEGNIAIVISLNEKDG